MKAFGIAIIIATIWYFLTNYVHGYYGWGIFLTLVAIWNISEDK